MATNRIVFGEIKPSEWNNEFSITVPVIDKDYIENDTYIKRRVLYILKLEGVVFKQVRLDKITDFGVYRAVAEVAGQKIGFAVWVVRDAKKDCNACEQCHRCPAVCNCNKDIVVCRNCGGIRE